MKKNTLLLLVVIALAAIVGWFIIDRGSGTINEALRDFAVKDTAGIVKIFLANKSGQQTLLEKQPGGDWLMNGKFVARPDAVKMLLATVHDVEVRSPISKSGYNNVIKAIAANGIKVELYDRKGLIKTYYVGGPTQDQLGTFMYLENSTVPFITHILGFDGYLTPRYIVNEEDWKIKNVFRLSDGKLKLLKVIDREQPDRSLIISRSDDGNYALTDGAGNAVPGVVQDKVINYLQSYRMLNYEAIEKSLTPGQTDSLKSTQPFRTIELTDVDNRSTRIDLWRRPITGSTSNKTREDGTPFPYDIDRMTASLNGDSMMIVVQYYSFEKLFRKPADFLVQPSGKY